MAMLPGSVTINAATGEDLGTGAAGAVYAAMKAREPIAQDGDPSKLQTMIAARQALAGMAEDIGATLITYILANAEAVIGTGAAGLQRTPNPNNPDVDTKAPTAEKTLPIR